MIPLFVDVRIPPHFLSIDFWCGLRKTRQIAITSPIASLPVNSNSAGVFIMPSPHRITGVTTHLFRLAWLKTRMNQGEPPRLLRPHIVDDFSRKDRSGWHLVGGRLPAQASAFSDATLIRNLYNQEIPCPSGRCRLTSGLEKLSKQAV